MKHSGEYDMKCKWTRQKQTHQYLCVPTTDDKLVMKTGKGSTEAFKSGEWCVILL